MSATSPDAVRRCYEMCRRRCRTMSAVRVLDYLYWCHRRFGRATPSHEQIAAATGYCTRTVGRATHELEHAGALRVWRDTPHRREDGTFTRTRTNLYRLKWPPRAVKSLVAPRGHMRHVKAPYRAVAPPGAPVQPALPALEVPETEVVEPPAPPTWVRLGITRAEWYAAGRPDA